MLFRMIILCFPWVCMFVFIDARIRIIMNKRFFSYFILQGYFNFECKPLSDRDISLIKFIIKSKVKKKKIWQFLEKKISSVIVVQLPDKDIFEHLPNPVMKPQPEILSSRIRNS